MSMARSRSRSSRVMFVKAYPVIDKKRRKGKKDRRYEAGR